VTGAASDDDARLAARQITDSNLVRTAIHGADPNWGRILAAAGRSGARVEAEQHRTTVAGDELHHGIPDPEEVARTAHVVARAADGDRAGARVEYDVQVAQQVGADHAVDLHHVRHSVVPGAVETQRALIHDGCAQPARDHRPDGERVEEHRARWDVPRDDA